MHMQGGAGECMCKVAHVQGGAVHVHVLSVNTFANHLRERTQNAVFHEVRLGRGERLGPSDLRTSGTTQPPTALIIHSECIIMGPFSAMHELLNERARKKRG